MFVPQQPNIIAGTLKVTVRTDAFVSQKVKTNRNASKCKNVYNTPRRDPAISNKKNLLTYCFTSPPNSSFISEKKYYQNKCATIILSHVE